MGSGTLQPNSGLNLFTDADPIVPEEFNPVVEAVEANTRHKGSVPTGTDVDTLTASGEYHISGAYSYTNLPPGVSWGVITVSRGQAAAGFASQLMITYNSVWARFYQNDAWVAWMQLNQNTTISSGNLAGVVFNANLADNSIYHLSVGRDPGFYLITTFGTVTITTIVDIGTGGGSSITTSGGLNLKIDFGGRGRPYKLQKVQ